jgi:phospholipid transport system substrate-binding protein
MSPTTRALLATLVVVLCLAHFQGALASTARDNHSAAAEDSPKRGRSSRRAHKGDSALATFKATHRKVRKLVAQKASSRRIQQHVDKLLDYDWIAETALGGPPKAEERCWPRCEEFKVLLTKLIRKNYLRLIRKSHGRSVEYVGDVSRKRVSKVKTRVTFVKDGHERDVRVTYVMHKVGGSWQVRDIVTGGASLVRNYRFEFNKILRDQGIDGLLLSLQNKLDSLAATKK